MIYHIAERDNDFTLRDFVKVFAPELTRRFQTINTHQLATATKMPVGTYLFTDMERQNPLQIELQAQVFAQLEAAGSCRLLNEPGATLDRLQLINTLFDKGFNSYRAFPALGPPTDLRFPVFIRVARDHGGSHTPLLSDWDEYEEAVCRLSLASRDLNQMIVVEFADPSGEDGIYAKYCAFRVGEQIIPRAVYFGREWMQKDQDHQVEFRSKLKQDYVHDNPHEQHIRTVFELAKVDYGRMDYGICNGKIEVWEINSNPKYVSEDGRGYSEEEQEMQNLAFRRVANALEKLDTGIGGSVPIQVTWRSPRTVMPTART